MLTFEKILVIVTMIIVTFGGNIIAIDEGDTCSFPGGKLGVCTRLTECTLIDNGLKDKTISPKNIVHCSFIGNIHVICCPNRESTNIKPTRYYPYSQGGIVFPGKTNREDLPNSIATKVELSSTLPPSTTTTTLSPPQLIGQWVLSPYTIDWDESTLSTTTTTTTTTTPRKVVKECEIYKSEWGPGLGFHIIDGEPTKPGEFPHMAGLGYRKFDTDEYTFDCGGSLISNRYILTAAHCVDNREPKVIRLGKTTVRNNDDGVEAVDVQIKSIFIHPDYRSFAKYDDIALIEMTEPVKFINEVGPACLYTNEDDLSDSEILVATGWGVNDVDKRTFSNILLKVNLTSNPLNNCNQSYFDYGFTRQYSAGLVSGQMCAYDKKFDKDTCQGDSGSPLQLVNQTTHLSTIVGLTSFGIGCGSTMPSVYTRVALYLDWIESIVWP